MPLIIRLKDGQVGIIERDGHYNRTIFPGKIHFKIPVIEEFFLFDLKAKTYKLPKFSLLIKNDYTIDVEVITKYKVVEPRKARYDVENKDLEYTIERYVIRTLSHAIGEMDLEEAINKLADLSEQVKRQLDAKSRQWGFKLYFLEIKSLKKSFLTEQEKENLYDFNKSQKGTYISEIVDTSGTKKSEVDEALANAYGNFNELTDMIENQDVQGASQALNTKIAQIQNQMESTENKEIKDIQQQQIEIFKNHQQEMLKLDEKDIQSQQALLMAEIAKMAKKQEELLQKQEDLAQRQYNLDQKKQALATLSDESDAPEQEDQKTFSEGLQQFSDVEKDTFTGLLNLAAFQRYLSDKFFEATENNQTITVFFFESVALDTMEKDYSVTTADAAIRNIADAIIANLSENDLVSRYSRKEFALASNIDNPEKVTALAQKIIQTANNTGLSYMGESIDLKMKVSIILKSPETQLDYDQTKEMAEKAMKTIRTNDQQSICLLKTS